MPLDTRAFTRSSRGGGGGGGGGGIVTVGRLSAQKRIPLLLEAVAQLRATGRGLPLTIVGDGPERPALERRAAGLEVADLVRFLGEVPPARIPDVLGDADVFAFPAIGEGLGLAAAEALMLGVPIVATRDGGGITDIVPSNGAGRLVQPDAREFARALRELADTPDSRRLAAEAGAALRRRFDPAGVAERDWSCWRGGRAWRAGPPAPRPSRSRRLGWARRWRSWPRLRRPLNRRCASWRPRWSPWRPSGCWPGSGARARWRASSGGRTSSVGCRSPPSPRARG